MFPKMSLSEADLVSELGSCGWSGDLPTWTPNQRARLKSLLLAQCTPTEELMPRLERVMRTYSAQLLEPAQNNQAPENRIKLSTQVARKFKELGIRLEAVIEAYELAELVLRAFAVLMGPAVADTFDQSSKSVAYFTAHWRRADDWVEALEYVFEKGGKGCLAREDVNSLGRFFSEWSKLRASLDTLSAVAREVLDESSGPLQVCPAEAGALTPSGPLQEVYGFLVCLRDRLSRVDIVVKRGPDMAAERELVQSLANLLQMFTGEAPKRRYESIGRGGTPGRGEYTPFLNLCRLVARYGREGIGLDWPPTMSLAGIVRDVLD